MTFKTRNIPKQFDSIVDFGLENLVVSGCSFTYNNSDQYLCTWPYYLRDLGNFKQVYDSSLPGGGNYHISQSLQWCLELEDLDPKNTLIVVMWPGNDRDNFILHKTALKSYPFSFKYTDDVYTGIRGINVNSGNIFPDLSKLISVNKNTNSRSVENFLHKMSTWHYLKSKGYRFYFLNYANHNDIKDDFEINDSVPLHLRKKYNNMFLNVPTLYNWAVKHDFLTDDMFHPTPDGHLKWTQQVLIPSLIKDSK